MTLGDSDGTRLAKQKQNQFCFLLRDDTVSNRIGSLRRLYEWKIHLSIQNKGRLVSRIFPVAH